jgi:UPF0755 protein
VILASIVERKPASPKSARWWPGYSNRLRQGIMLQADPTIIYPITAGKPLGRRIRQSEIQAKNGYNTYSMTGLPKGPITNPGGLDRGGAAPGQDAGAVYGGRWQQGPCVCQHAGRA